MFAKPRLPPATAAKIFGTDETDPLATPAPIFDRATQGLYPTGSTFKPITAIAALASGNLGPRRDHNDSG